MNPNKKTLNSKTNNSPWLLCPSKSFPGKFYYFNGLTGETAWSLNDSDHKNLNKDTIDRVEDIGHPYAEPLGPPGDDQTNTSSSSFKKDFPSANFNNNTNFNGLSFSNLPNFNKGTKFGNLANFSNTNCSLGSNINGTQSFGNKPQVNFSTSPVWGQSVFPQYREKSYPSKVIWTVIPMLVNEEPFHMSEPPQFNSPDMFLHNPLHNNLFQPFNRPQTNPFYKVNSSPAVHMGTPVFSTKPRYESKVVQTFDQEPPTKEEACQTFEPEKEQQIQPKLSKPVLQPSKFPVKPSCVSVGSETEKEVNVHTLNNVNEIGNASKSISLGDNDLRFLLEAKRKKSVDSSECQQPVRDVMPISQCKESTLKKRVTFNLGDHEDGVIPENEKVPVSTFTPQKLVAEPKITYVVPDSEVLLANYEYIENNVLSAENCQLLVPFVVKSKMEAISRGAFRGRYDVLAVRYALRKLTTPTHNIIVQPKPEHIISCEEDSILDCCWQYSQDNCHLSLLTSNTELIKKSEIIGINCSVFNPIRQEIISAQSAKNFDTDAQNNNKALTNKNTASHNLFEVTQTDLVCLDIGKLDIGDGGRNQSELVKKEDKIKTVERNAKNDIKVSGITKLNSVFNLDEEIARYYVKNDIMKQRLASRIDEWVARLIQAMETLIDVLLKEKVKKNMPPKDLHELVQNIGITFRKHTKIRNVVENLLTHLQRNVTKFIKMKPMDFMKLLGFCMILVQCLKEIFDYKELCDADDLLSALLKHIEDPNTDKEFSLEKVSTPVLSEVELEAKVPLGYKKKQSNVIEYLKKHFPGAFLPEVEGPKIVRTVGKDLNCVKVFNTKDIVVDDSKVTRDVKPEVVKKFKVIEAFEKRLKKPPQIYTDDEYEECQSTVLSERTLVLNVKNHINKENNEKMNKLDYSEDYTDCPSSEIENECIYAYPLVKAFLAELRTTFVIIFNFVSDTMQFEHSPMSKNERSELDFKIDEAYSFITQIVNRLESIIARESGSGTTLKSLLIRAGDYVEENETMSRYKDVITKYLEQAKILEEALELLSAMRNDPVDTTSIYDKPSCS